MPRIRSVHPGLFTDEEFMQLSSDAQVLLIGLWTEADDDGIFDWKPLTLKVRLRGGKDGSIDPLLSELVAVDCIRPTEIGGRKVGLIRNFRRYQRPKFPKSNHMITDEIRIYVGLTHPITEIEADEVTPFRPNAEKSPQMEDGGDKREKKEPPNPRKRGPEEGEFEEVFWPEYPIKAGKSDALKAFLKARKTVPIQQIMLGLERYKAVLAGADPPKPKYAQGWLNGSRFDDDLPASTNGVSHETPDEITRRVRLKGLRDHGVWLADWGDRPDTPEAQR